MLGFSLLLCSVFGIGFANGSSHRKYLEQTKADKAVRGVNTSQSKSVIRAKTSGDLVCSSNAMQFQWNCSSSVPSVNGNRFGSVPV